MPRFVLLKTVDVDLVAAPAPTSVLVTATTATPKLDPVVEFVGVDSDGRFSFNVPLYDVATHNKLVALHVSLFEKDATGKATIPADAASIVKTPNSFVAVLHEVASFGGPVVVDATNAPEGKYSAALVAEFDA